MTRGVAKIFNGMRECTGCKEVLPTYAFYAHSQRPGTTHSQCKKCENAATIKRTKANPERTSRYSRKSRIKTQYGLSWDDFQKIVSTQGGACPICKNQLDFNANRRVHIDHDHATGKVRGVLCNWCNSGLGRFKDNARWLDAAAQYIRLHTTLKVVS